MIAVFAIADRADGDHNMDILVARHQAHDRFPQVIVTRIDGQFLLIK